MSVSAQTSAGRSAPTLLLPPRARLGGELRSAPQLARLLARGDSSTVAAGEEAQLMRCFDVLPRALSVAALTRQYDCADAAHHAWLRADPAHVRADLGSARVLAIGGLRLEADQAQSLVASLRVLFGDEGFPISAGSAERWYLMLPRDARVPRFAPPREVLGDDLFAHLPEGDGGRRWRRLLNEAQVLLHHHPVNIERARAGQLPVNSLWFWGGGVLPDHVRCGFDRVCSDDVLVRALAARAGVAHESRATAHASVCNGRTLLDLRDLDSLEAMERDWVGPCSTQVRGDAVLTLDGGDGFVCRYRRSHRWRVWRRTPR